MSKRSIERRRPFPEPVVIGAALALLAGCVVDDGSTATTSSTSSAEGSSDPGSEDDGPAPESTAGSGSDATTAAGDTTAGAADSTDDGADGSSSGGPACEPSAFTEVRACPDPVGEGFCSEGAEHVADGTEIPWMSDPPHSGPHYPMWETWGEHDTSVPRGNWVHNLEHGGIVLAYLCPGGCDAELDVLRAVIEARPELRILMTSDPLLPGPRFAAISWTWVYRTDAPDLDTLLCFVDQHENHAPEDVP